MREEYPRPQFERKDWLCLNGTWEFAFDDDNLADTEHWERPEHSLPLTIEVPFCFESKLSGIADTTMHDRICYKKTFQLPDAWSGKRILLHFGAVDYECRVYVNGMLCKEHIGGNTPFETDITDYLTEGLQSLTVKVYDPARDETIPRGKQYWEEKSAGIWYTRTSGIWQSVWLEPVSNSHISHMKFTPDIDADMVILEAFFENYCENMSLEVAITFQGEFICRDTYSINNPHVFKHGIHLAKDHIFNSMAHGNRRYWTPENPVLYDVTLTLHIDGIPRDCVSSYFGMRKIHTKGGMTYLNNNPYYFKFVLDQGYWREGILTAPSDQDFVTDIQLMKEMGFNGCRKHQKTEDPRFLYHADKMGFLVWGEMAAACIYTDRGVTEYAKEWFDIVRRDYNHPSIVAWVPFNESWAVPNVDNNERQQNQTLGMYYLLKSLDPTRMVINNDGWELTKSDICAIHNYSHGSTKEPEKQAYYVRTLNDLSTLLSATHAGKDVYAEGFSYQGEPILITECGGINFDSAEEGSWGYTSAASEEDFLAQYRHVISNILQSDHIYGFCYTQLSDVEQETNGLLTYDRVPKCKPSKIKEINEGFRHNMAFINN